MQIVIYLGGSLAGRGVVPGSSLGSAVDVQDASTSLITLPSEISIGRIGGLYISC